MKSTFVIKTRKIYEIDAFVKLFWYQNNLNLKISENFVTLLKKKTSPHFSEPQIFRKNV